MAAWRWRSLLLLELALVLLDARTDVVGQGEQLEPLLLVERDREAAEPVDGQPALLAHLHRDGSAADAARLERRVLGLEPLQFGLQLCLGAHAVSGGKWQSLGRAG